jgi:hypothetical protein
MDTPCGITRKLKAQSKKKNAAIRGVFLEK